MVRAFIGHEKKNFGTKHLSFILLNYIILGLLGNSGHVLRKIR